MVAYVNVVFVAHYLRHFLNIMKYYSRSFPSEPDEDGQIALQPTNDDYFSTQFTYQSDFFIKLQASISQFLNNASYSTVLSLILIFFFKTMYVYIIHTYHYFPSLATMHILSTHQMTTYHKIFPRAHFYTESNGRK